MYAWLIDCTSLLTGREWICAALVAALVAAWVWWLNHDGFPPMDP